MLTNMRLSKGTRRHIRNQKAAIRRQFGDSEVSREKILELIRKFPQTVLSEQKPVPEVQGKKAALKTKTRGKSKPAK